MKKEDVENKIIIPLVVVVVVILLAEAHPLGSSLPSPKLI